MVAPISEPAENGMFNLIGDARLSRNPAKRKSVPFLIAPFSVKTIATCVVPVGIENWINVTASGHLQ